MKYYIITAIIALAAAKAKDKPDKNMNNRTPKKVNVESKQKRRAKGSSPASSRRGYPAATTA